ncbi:hypothetical protein P7C70_g7005, partial [Phenoliferia sp. Uapishka_3]
MGENWRSWGPGEKEDAEDLDWAPESESGDGSSSEEESGSDGSDEEGDGQGAEDDDTPTMTLYADLSLPPTTSSPPSSPPRASSSLTPYSPPDSSNSDDLTPILLAHHLRPQTSTPLTRRRYRTLTNPTANNMEQDSFLEAMVARRKEVEWRSVDEGEERMGRWCVVCLGEERCVILWPCRKSLV